MYIEDKTKREFIYKQIRHIKDFPKKGIILRDLTLCLTKPFCYSYVIDLITEKLMHMIVKGKFEQLKDKKIDWNRVGIVSIEAKGFIWGSLLAQQLFLPIIMVRKKGKLPGTTKSITYSNEYATETIEVDIDSIKNIDYAFFIDDVLATGETALAVERLLAPKVKILYNFHVIELTYLQGKDKLKGKNYSLFSIST